MACLPEETRMRWGVDEGSACFEPRRIGRRRRDRRAVERALTCSVSSHSSGLVL